MTTIELRERSGSRPDARWTRRPVLGGLVRGASLIVPFAMSVATAWTLTATTPEPATLLPAIGRWIAIAVASSLVLFTLERVGRRLLPIATLLDLTLAFPDQAPSRFSVALRTGTTAQLARRVAEARNEAVADPTISAGQRVIELVAALSVHDRITRGHSERVRAYTQMIADEMGLPESERDKLRWAGLLHDVGKLLVPTSILNKDGRLTDAEFDIIKSHPENGRRIIEDLVPWLGESARAVWEHHEKWDGSGYPRGLAGEEISLAARIVAVADVYDVMTSARSYKDPVSPKEARAELARCAGSHFDPAVVRAFLNLSLGRVRRAAGPLSWAAQVSLFPTAVIGSTHAASSAIVITGAITASSASVGTEFAADALDALDPRDMVSWVRHGDGPADAADDGFGTGLDPASFQIAAPSTFDPESAEIIVVERSAGIRLGDPIVDVDPSAFAAPTGRGADLGSGGTNRTPTTVPPDVGTATTSGAVATVTGPPVAGADAPPPGSGANSVATTLPPAPPATSTTTTTTSTTTTTLPITTTTLPITTTTTLPTTTLPTTTLPATTTTTLPITTTTIPATTIPATTIPATTVPVAPPAIGGGGGPDGTGPPGLGPTLDISDPGGGPPSVGSGKNGAGSADVTSTGRPTSNRP